MSHAAGLTAHTAIVLFGSSKFLGRDELGHSRTTVGLTRSRGVTVVAGPPDPYGLIGMVQTVYCYYYTAHSTTWEPGTEVYPFDDRPQDLLATIRLFEPVSWGPVPLALRITFPDATCHALRLTLRRRRLPHPEEQVLTPDGSPVYPRVTGSEAPYCFWCYTSAHTCRPVAWLLPFKGGLCLRFRRNTQCVLRLRLPSTGKMVSS